MISRLKRKWTAWRLEPGLRISSEVAYYRAYGNKNSHLLGPELNLISLSNDLRKFKLHLEVGQEELGPEFEKVLEENRWALYARG
jgi:hypothetical protein